MKIEKLVENKVNQFYIFRKYHWLIDSDVSSSAILWYSFTIYTNFTDRYTHPSSPFQISTSQIEIIGIETASVQPTPSNSALNIIPNSSSLIRIPNKAQQIMKQPKSVLRFPFVSTIQFSGIFSHENHNKRS